MRFNHICWKYKYIINLINYSTYFIVAKRKSLFNDRPQEIQELTYIIKEDLNSLNQQIAKLQEVAKLQKATQNNVGRKHLLSHESSVVLSLQSKLANISNEFKQVLEIRTKVSLLYVQIFVIFILIRIITIHA